MPYTITQLFEYLITQERIELHDFYKSIVSKETFKDDIHGRVSKELNKIHAYQDQYWFNMVADYDIYKLEFLDDNLKNIKEWEKFNDKKANQEIKKVYTLGKQAEKKLYDFAQEMLSYSVT